MTNEEIQAIRNQYKYDPSMLNTGVESPTNVNTRLARFRGQETKPEEKGIGQKAKEVATGFAKSAGKTGVMVASTLQDVGQAVLAPMGGLEPNVGIEALKKETPQGQALTQALEEKTPEEKLGGKLETGTEILLGGGAQAIKSGVKAVAKSKVGQKVIGEVAQTAGKLRGAVAEKVAERNIAKVSELINPTEDIMTPLQRKQAITEGRQTIRTTKLGGTEVAYTPTKETERASEILSKTIKSGDKPNVVFAKTKSEIAKRGAEAENYLAKNPVKITNAEDANIFSSVKAQAEKNLTETEMKAYDEQIKLFQKQLLGRKGGYTTENYYKALKDWEENIAEHLPKGKEAILDPSGVASAKIHAASDIRKAVRDLIGSKHPEFRDKMYDIASLYEAKGNALQIASKQKSKTFLEKNPKIRKALEYGTAGTIIGGGFNILKD